MASASLPSVPPELIDMFDALDEQEAAFAEVAPR
jgi:hypothetical protein